jgi:uncharacterized membrane protein YsdA (DUF1294 family)
MMMMMMTIMMMMIMMMIVWWIMEFKWKWLDKNYLCQINWLITYNDLLLMTLIRTGAVKFKC